MHGLVRFGTASSLKCRSEDGFPLSALRLNVENLFEYLLPCMAEKYLASKTTKNPKKQWLGSFFSWPQEILQPLRNKEIKSFTHDNGAFLC